MQRPTTLFPTTGNQGQIYSQCPETLCHIKVQFSPASSLCSLFQSVTVLRFSGSHLETACGVTLAIGYVLAKSHMAMELIFLFTYLYYTISIIFAGIWDGAGAFPNDQLNSQDFAGFGWVQHS